MYQNIDFLTPCSCEFTLFQTKDFRLVRIIVPFDCLNALGSNYFFIRKTMSTNDKLQSNYLVRSQKNNNIYYDRHIYRHIFIVIRLMNDESTVGILLFITCYWKSLCFFSSGFPFTRISLLFWHICTDQLCWVCNMGKHIIYIWIENSLFARLW